MTGTRRSARCHGQRLEHGLRRRQHARRPHRPERLGHLASEGAFLSGTVSVSSDSADAGSGVASALFERRPAGGGAWTAIGTDTSAPYSVNWNTSALNGDFDLHVVTTDTAGNAHSSSVVTVTVDNTAPSAPVISLSESSPYAHVSGQTVFVNTGQSGSYDVTATSSDAQSGIEKIRFPGPTDDTSSPYGTSYGFGALSGSQTVTAYNSAGLTASDTFTVTPDTSGPNAFSLTAPGAGASIANGQTVSASPVDSGAGIDQVEFRYCAGSSCAFASGTTIGSPDSTAPYSVTWNGQPADGTYTIVARATDNVGNTTNSAERTVTVDNTGPSSVLSVNEGTRGDLQYFDSATDTYYYNPAATGDFSLHDVAGDPAGVASVDFPAIADTGFSGSAKNDASSPFDSNTYTFTTASASAPATQTVVVTDALGNASNDAFDIVRDVTAPSGGSVSYADGYDADGSVVVATANGSDSGAGVDASSGVLERRTSTFSGGSCAGFAGGWTTATSPDTVASGLCAQYRYRVSDRVGNEAIYTSTDVVKVDLTAPSAPALTLSESSAWAFVSGTTIYLNTAQTGSYDVDATTTDSQSGIDKVSFPAGQDDSTSPYQAAYAFGDLSGSQTVTARSNAGLTTSSNFTVTADTAAPTGGSVTYTDGYDADGQVTISTPNGNDPLSGIDASSGVLESRTSALTSGSCAGFSGGWTTVTSPDTVATATCAQYRYRVSDNVGNEAIYTSTNFVKVDTSSPSAPVVSLSESSPYAHVSGQTVFVNTGQSGSYDVSATSSDAQSGIEKIRFPGPTDDSSSPYGTSYGFGALSGSQTVTAYNNAGLTASDTFTVTPDTTAPATTDDTGTIGSAWRNAPVTVTLSPSDGGAGVGGDLLHDRRLHPDDELLAGHEHRPDVERRLHDQVLLGRPGRQYRSRQDRGHADPHRPDQPDFPRPHAQRVEPVRARDRDDGLRQEWPDRHLYRRRDLERPAFGDQQDPLPGRRRRLGLPVPDDLRAGRPHGHADRHGIRQRRQHVVEHLRRDHRRRRAFRRLGQLRERLRLRRPDPGLDLERHGRPVRSGRLDRRPRAPHLRPHGRLVRRLLGRLDGGLEPRHRRDQHLRAVPLPRLRPRLERGRLHLRERGQGRPDRAQHLDRLDPERPDERDGRDVHLLRDRDRLDVRVRARRRRLLELHEPRGLRGPCPKAATPSGCARRTSPGTRTPRRRSSRGWSTRARRTRRSARPRTTRRTRRARPSPSAPPRGLDLRVRARRRRLLQLLEPEELCGLGDGSHTFRVRATDQAGNTDGSAAQFTWTVDTAAPNTAIDVFPPDPDSSPSPSFQFSSTEGGSTFECELDGGGFSSCSSPKSYSGPRRRQPHLQGARHRPGREHRRDAGFLHVGRERGRPERLDHRAERVREPRRRRPVHRHGHEP